MVYIIPIYIQYYILYGLNKLIEKVQNKFTKRIYFRFNFIKSTYDTRLYFLNLMNLSHHRLRANMQVRSMLLAFKIEQHRGY